MSEENKVVNEDLTASNSEVVKTQVQEVKVSEETQTKPVQAGDRTDPNLLLKSLREEREKVKRLEEEINTIKSSTLPEIEEAFSDEGKLLETKIKNLESKLEILTSESAKKDLQNSNPVFKEKWEEFEAFRQDPENKGMNLKTAAKAFLVEQEIYETPRKGLEKTTGGPRTPTSTGMTQEEVETLRTTNFRRYQELLKKGQLKIG